MKWALSTKINLKVVALCLLAATTFWFFRALSTDYAANITVGFKIKYDKNNYVSIGEPESQLNVNVTGYGWNLLGKNMGFGDQEVVIDLDAFKNHEYVTGAQLMPVLTDQLEGVRVNFVHNDTVVFNFDEKVTRKIKLSLDSRVVPESIRLLSEASIVPNQISVTGPRSVVAKIGKDKKIKVEAIALGQPLKDWEIDVSSQFPESVSISDPRVKCSVDLVKYVSQTKVVKVELRHFPAKLEEELGEIKASVKFTIDNRSLESEGNKSFKLVADYNYLQDDTQTVPIKIIRYPSKVKDFHISPTELEVPNE